MAISPSKTKKCPTCKRKRGDISYGAWWAHLNRCSDNREKYRYGCKCGKREKDFKSLKAFATHAYRCGLRTRNEAIQEAAKERAAKAADTKKKTKKIKKTKKTFPCKKCTSVFASHAALITHTWIHQNPSFGGGEWGDKDEIRYALQLCAAQRLKRLDRAKRIAICLPGQRPDHESALLSNPGFKKIHMVERIEKTCMANREKGFDVYHGDFLVVLNDLVNSGTRLALIDYDLCGTITFSDGIEIVNAIRMGGLADIAAIRMTCCRRNTRRDGEKDILALNREIELAVPPGHSIVGRDNHRYVGKDRSAMVTSQWLIEKES